VRWCGGGLRRDRCLRERFVLVIILGVFYGLCFRVLLLFLPLIVGVRRKGKKKNVVVFVWGVLCLFLGVV
jgi:hypothetical protein